MEHTYTHIVGFMNEKQQTQRAAKEMEIWYYSAFEFVHHSMMIRQNSQKQKFHSLDVVICTEPFCVGMYQNCVVECMAFIGRI